MTDDPVTPSTPWLPFRFGRTLVPSGTSRIGAAMVVAGASAYGFLVISARQLGPEKYSGLGALWFIGFLAGPGLFMPIEQEVARSLAAGGGRDDYAVVRRAGLLGVGLLAITLVAHATAPAFLGRLFDGNAGLVWAFFLMLAGYLAEHYVRGILAGRGDFGRYARLLAVEGLVRLAGAIALVVFGSSSTAAFGLVLGGAPFVAVLAALPRERSAGADAPPAPWARLSRWMGLLLASSILAQVLANAGPIGAKLLARPDQLADAGRFVTAVVVTRAPLYLFGALQATVLPHLARMASRGETVEYRRGVARLVMIVAAVSLVAVVGAATIGREVITVLFGRDFASDRIDLTLVATASGAYVVALALAQAHIARGRYACVTLGWLVGAAVLVVASAVTDGDFVRRIALAWALGSTVSAALMAVTLRDPTVKQSGA